MLFFNDLLRYAQDQPDIKPGHSDHGVRYIRPHPYALDVRDAQHRPHQHNGLQGIQKHEVREDKGDRGINNYTGCKATPGNSSPRIPYFRPQPRKKRDNRVG